MSDSSDIIFAHWKEHVQEDYGTSRFTKVVTKEVLANLVETFKHKSFDMDTALSYQRRVVDFMVTEEGRRGGKNKRTGKDYKNWVDGVKDAFKAAIGDCYTDDLSSPVILQKDSMTDYLMNSELVKSWVEAKFGSNQDILLEVCKDSTSLNIQMQEDLFNSDWSRTGENVPDYVKKSIV